MQQVSKQNQFKVCSLRNNKISLKGNYMSQNLKFKVKEFEWFEMQTKVRQIIQEVLGPIQKRILQTSSVLNKVKTNQATDENRITEISLMIANDPNVFQTGVFATVDRRFQQHARLIEQLKRQIQQQNKYVQNKFKILDLRMEESSEVLKNIASLKERVCREMQIQNDNINSLRKNIEVMIQDLNKDIRETKKIIIENKQVSEKRDSQIEEQIRRIKDNLLTIEDNISLHRDMHHEKTLQLQQHSQIIGEFDMNIKDLFENKRLTKRLGDLVEDMDIEIKKTIFKVQSITPLVTQAQISQILSAILPQKLKNKICIFDYKKYYTLNREVLQKDFKVITNKFNGLQLLQNMQKKSTKEIVQLKRKKLLEMGIDIDHVSYEQRQKYYQQVNLDDELNMQYEQNKVQQKVDESEIQRILSRFMNEYLESFKEQIKIQIQDNKKYIYGVEEEIKYQISGFEKNIESVKNQLSTFHVENILEIKKVTHFADQIQGNLNKLQDKQKQFQDLSRLFYNFCSLVNHLAIQDEIDKQNISLFGAKELKADDMNFNVKQMNSVVNLDGKCFSCNGYPATTLSAFKMACLAYYPSPIKIDTKNYKRQELLQFTTSMLQNIKKMIQNVPNINEQSASKQLNFSGKQIQKSKYNKLDKRLRFQTYGQQSFQLKNTINTKHLATQQNLYNDIQLIDKKKSISINKLRKTKKQLDSTMSTSCYNSKQNSNSLKKNDELISTTVIFNSLRKKNHSFLN